MALDLGANDTELSQKALGALESYPWPGNIRELRNVLERAILLSGNRILTERDLNFDTSPEMDQLHTGFARTLAEVERAYIEEVLLKEGGRVEAAAKRLGIPRSSLYQKIKEFGILRPGTPHHSEHAADRGNQ